MPWQQHVADVALEVNPATGRLAYRRVVLTVPRQSGKTTLMLAVFLHRALGMRTPQVMAYAAQNGLDARMRLQREWHKSLERNPTFRETYTPSWATGAEALLFHNGSRLQVVAGTEKSGHGQTLDLAMVDEAFAQRDGRLEQALGPAMMTRPEPQLWFISTAGSPSDAWFREKVERGRQSVLNGDDGVAFFEWSAPPDAELHDRAVWRSCMPALGHTVTEAVVAAECLGMAPDEFRRAYLNQWVDRGSDGAFSQDTWAALADPQAERGAFPVFAVATDPDSAWSAIAVAWRRPDGHTQVMVADYRPGTAWVAERVAALRHWSGRVIVDRAARPLLLDAEAPSDEALAQAHNALATAVEGRTVRHGNQSELNTAVRAAAWKPVGDTRKLDRKGSTDLSPLVAAALAFHAVHTGDDAPNLW